jgi:hypothetical protein
MRFSTWPELANVITSIGPLAVALSWGTIIIQMMFLPMLINRVTRIMALIGIFGFHLGIAFFMGLPFFSFAMVAIDSIFIRDATWRHLRTTTRRAWLDHADTPPVDLQPPSEESAAHAHDRAGDLVPL